MSTVPHCCWCLSKRRGVGGVGVGGGGGEVHSVSESPRRPQSFTAACASVRGGREREWKGGGGGEGGGG